MTRHLPDGVLRRLVDEPAGVPDADRAHVRGCARCTALLAEIRTDAEHARTALDTNAAGAGTGAGTADEHGADAAWSRLRTGLASGAAPTAPVHPGSRADVVALPTRRRLLRRPVAAAVGALVVLTGAGAAAANDWLPIFRTEQVAPVTITEADLVDLPDLSAFGEMRVEQEPELRAVADGAAAAAATGLSAPEVAELPRGVAGDPTYQVSGEVSGVFTFSAQKAAAAAAAAGEALPTPPAGLDGSELRLVAGPGVVASWTSEQGAPSLVVVRAVAPTAFASGVDFATARDYLLSLPGVPQDVAAQLRAFSDDGTLPIFLPAGPVTSTTTQVDGVPATLVESEDGMITGVIWVKDGVVTAVGGPLDADELLAVARGLR